MAYSTGSGIYTDLMAAILAHALADGWTEVGGLGTGWPIETPGTGLFFDWTSVTVVENDLTAGGDGSPKTQRILYINMSRVSGADATAKGTSPPSVNYGANYSITQWHIFSEPAVSDHIMVVYEISNGVDAQVFQHFGFGELDPAGLTHGGIGFHGGGIGRPYALTNGSGTGAGDWNSVNRNFWPYAGAWGEEDDAGSRLTINIDGTSHPIPSPGPGVGGWPNVDVDISGGTQVWRMSRPGVDLIGPNMGSNNISLNWLAVHTQPKPFLGDVSMMPCPIFLINGTAATSTMCYVGDIPNHRMCSMEGFNPADEVSFAGDTWMLFPLLCQKPNSTLNTAFVVTSGQVGLAYKKVT